LFVSRIEVAADTCLLIEAVVVGSGIGAAADEATLAAKIEDRLLSLRLSSPWRSRMASSMDDVIDSFSAVASS